MTSSPHEGCYCNGGGWMLNEPLFGPCSRVTPSRVQGLRAEVAELADQLAEVDAALSEYLVSIGLPARPVTGLPDALSLLVGRIRPV